MKFFQRSEVLMGIAVLLFLGVSGFGMVGCCKPQPVLSDAQVITITHNCEANGMEADVAVPQIQELAKVMKAIAGGVS